MRHLVLTTLLFVLGASGCESPRKERGFERQDEEGRPEASGPTQGATGRPPPAPAEHVFHEARPAQVWSEGHWTRTDDSWEWRRGAWLDHRSGYVYQQGYWGREGSSFVYRAPRWEPLRPGQVWVRGHWVHVEDQGGWRWGPGRWERVPPGQRWRRGRWVRVGGAPSWEEGRWEAID